MLMWVENFDPTPNNIDKVMSAEIPDEGNPLREIVTKCMIHGPCGSLNPSLSYMKNGRCKFNYPRDFQENAIFTEDAFPTHRRRSPENGGNTVNKRVGGLDVVITNRNIVPCPPYLVYKYQCHINMEYCAKVESMKYLFKYSFKVYDLVIV